MWNGVDMLKTFSGRGWCGYDVDYVDIKDTFGRE
jgi:hypothetical protein